MPLIFDAPPPAIIKSALPSKAHVGLSHSLIDDIARVEYEWLSFPKDIREASEEEFRAYLPRELRELPHWMATKGILFFVPYIISAAFLVKTTVNLTTTSTSNQAYSPVLTDWNVADNSIECGSHSGDGGNDASSSCAPFTQYQGGGGGGGGRALKNNVSLTPAGSMTFHNEAHGTGTGTGQATWANGATLAASSAGICGAGNGGDAIGDSTDSCCLCGGGSGGGAGGGGSTTGAIGDTKTAGSNGVGSTGGAGAGIAPAGGNNVSAGGDGVLRLINNKSL